MKREINAATPGAHPLDVWIKITPKTLPEHEQKVEVYSPLLGRNEPVFYDRNLRAWCRLFDNGSTLLLDPGITHWRTGSRPGADRAGENPAARRANAASGVLVAAPPPLTEAMIDAARQHITNGDDEESPRDPYEVRGRIVAIYRSFFGNPVAQAAEPKSQVGNFGDSTEAQLRQQLANVPLPNYIAGAQNVVKSADTRASAGIEVVPEATEQPPSESNMQKVHIPPTSANFARVQTEQPSPTEAYLIEWADTHGSRKVVSRHNCVGDYRAMYEGVTVTELIRRTAQRQDHIGDVNEMVQPHQAADLICKSCGADRLKEDCKGDRMRCGVAGSPLESVDKIGNLSTQVDSHLCQLVPVKPTAALLRPFYSCPPDELELAWQAMLRIANNHSHRYGKEGG